MRTKIIGPRILALALAVVSLQTAQAGATPDEPQEARCATLLTIPEVSSLVVRDRRSPYPLLRFDMDEDTIAFHRLSRSGHASYEDSHYTKISFISSFLDAFRAQVPKLGLDFAQLGSLDVTIYYYGEVDALAVDRMKANFFAALIETPDFRFVFSGASTNPAEWDQLRWALPGAYLAPSLGGAPGNVLLMLRSDEGLRRDSAAFQELLKELEVKYAITRDKIETGANDPFYAIRLTVPVGQEQKLIAEVGKNELLKSLISSASLNQFRGGSGLGPSAQLFRIENLSVKSLF